MAELAGHIKLTKDEFVHFSHATEYGCWGFKDHKVVVLLWNVDDLTWEKEICGIGYRTQKHAELQMLDKLEENPEGLEGTLNLYLSASPCSNCSAAIVKFKEDNPDVSVNIVFSSFYNVYKRTVPIELEMGRESRKEVKKQRENWDGLKTLFRTDGIKLKTFYGNKSWEPILPFVDQKDVKIKKLIANRTEREKIDRKIMRQLKKEVDEQRDEEIKGNNGEQGSEVENGEIYEQGSEYVNGEVYGQGRVKEKRDVDAVTKSQLGEVEELVTGMDKINL